MPLKFEGAISSVCACIYAQVCVCVCLCVCVCVTLSLLQYKLLFIMTASLLIMLIYLQPKKALDDASDLTECNKATTQFRLCK